MQKTEITLSFDGEKLDALEFYLKKENTTVQKRMNEALTELYWKLLIMTETTAKSSVGLLNSFSGRKGASCLTAAHTTKHGMERKKI